MPLQISDIFINDWGQLKADQAAILLLWRDKLVKAIDDGKHEIAGLYKSILVRHLCKKKKVFNQLSSYQIRDIADDLNFIHTSWYSFHITFLKTKLGTLYRPDHKLASFTFWQLVKADAEYSKFLIYNFQESKEQYHALDRLVAIIYQTKPGYFTDTNIEEHTAVLPKGLTFELKYLILHTYSNIRKYLVHERCPELFNAPVPRHPEFISGSADNSKQIPKQVRNDEQPQYTGDMWRQMLFDLSETPAFSGLETAKNARLFDALDYLHKKALEQTKTS
jgi:hypothetical protein